MISLKPTRANYVWETDDRAGYGFEVEAELGERGWSAHVTVKTHGFISAEAAVRHLEVSLRHLLSQMQEVGFCPAPSPPQDRAGEKEGE